MPLTAAKLRKTLEQMDAPELREAIAQLYRSSPVNKRLLAALLDNDARASAERCRAEITRAFGPARGFPTLKTAPARAALREYASVAAPPELLAMQLHHVEAGIRCTETYGDLEESVYSSIERMWAAALKLTAGLPERAVPWGRLESIVAASQGYGWGFSDTMQDLWDGFRQGGEA